MRRPDETYAQINYPLRLSPAICMVWVAVGTALASPIILWALMPFAALGAILPGHPFDVLYNLGRRHLLGTPARLRACYATIASRSRRHAAGGLPTRRLKARANAASES
jgi:hypothetical protein